MIVVIVWVYYSAQLFFFGSELTHAYTEHYLPASLRSSKKEEHSAAA